MKYIIHVIGNPFIHITQQQNNLMFKKALNHPGIMFIFKNVNVLVLLDASLNWLEYSKLFAECHEQCVHLGLLQMGDYN